MYLSTGTFQTPGDADRGSDAHVAASYVRDANECLYRKESLHRVTISAVRASERHWTTLGAGQTLPRMKFFDEQNET